MNPRPLVPPYCFQFTEGVRFNIALYSAPPGAEPYGGAGIGLLAPTGVGHSAALLAPLLHEGFGAGDYGMLPAKGRVTEVLMDRLMMQYFFPEAGKWVPGSPARIGNKGIDGLFFRTDGSGNIRNMLVGEAKYDSSRLGVTLSGRQLGERWINGRLLQTAKHYAEWAERLKEPLSPASSSARLRTDSRLLRIPLKDGGVAEVWKQRGAVRCYSDRPIHVAELRLQARRVADYLQASANGRSDYRCRVFRYRAVGRQHHITLREWDPKTATPGKVTALINGEYADLPKNVGKAVHRAFEREFRALGKSAKEAQQMADRACEDPGYFKRMSADARWTWKGGLDLYAMRTAALAGSFALALDVIFQLWATGKISWDRSIAMGGLGSFSGLMGHYGGVQLHSLLTATRIGRSILSVLPVRTAAAVPLPSFLGGVGGCLVATAAFAYGSYLLGFGDLQGAHRQVLAGGVGVVSGAGFSAGAFGFATAFGTASTGTAISSLSGIASTNAALAWLGGGTVAAGGYGVAGGLMVLTGGSAVIGIAAGLGVMYLVRLVDSVLDSRSRRALLEGRLDMVADRVHAGEQVEWRTRRSMT